MTGFGKQSTDFQEGSRRRAASNPEHETNHPTDGAPPAPSPAPDSKPATPTADGNPAATPDVKS